MLAFIISPGSYRFYSSWGVWYESKEIPHPGRIVLQHVSNYGL